MTTQRRIQSVSECLYSLYAWFSHPHGVAGVQLSIFVQYFFLYW